MKRVIRDIVLNVKYGKLQVAFENDRRYYDLKMVENGKGFIFKVKDIYYTPKVNVDDYGYILEKLLNYTNIQSLKDKILIALNEIGCEVITQEYNH